MKHRTPWQYEIEAINGVHTSMCNNLLSITNGQNQLYIMYYDVHSILRLIRYMPSNTNTVLPKSMRRFHLHLIDYVPRANMKIHTCCTVHSVHFQHRIRESDNDTCERERARNLQQLHSMIPSTMQENLCWQFNNFGLNSILIGHSTTGCS